MRSAKLHRAPVQYLLFSETNELLVLWRGQAEMLRVEWGTQNATLRKASACQRGYDYKPCTKSFILFQKVYKGRIYNFINIIIIIMLQKIDYVLCYLRTWSPNPRWKYIQVIFLQSHRILKPFCWPTYSHWLKSGHIMEIAILNWNESPLLELIIIWKSKVLFNL